MSQIAIKEDNFGVSCLPDELLLEIFNLFDGKSLKNIMLVCRGWHHVITQSASTMEKLPFSLNKFNINAAMVRNHKFYEAKLFRHDNFNNLSILNGSLQKLEISYCSFSGEDFKNLLLPFEQLKYLSLRRIQIINETDAEIAHKIMLNKFEMSQTDHKVLKVLKNCQVINFEIIEAGNRCDKKILLNFLKSQKLLENLVIEELLETNPCVLFLGDTCDFDFDFKLKIFSASFSTKFSENLIFQNNLINFLKNQSKFLREVKVFGILPKLVYAQIFSNFCKNLFLLEITADKIPQEKSFYEDMKCNNLNTLKIHSTITQSNFYGFKEFLKFCKNLKNLILNDTDNLIVNDLYNNISFNLLNLENLSILNFSLNYEPLNSIKSLKSFSITILKNVDQWLKFVLLNKNLESIKVGWMQRDFDVHVIDQILNSTKINRMKFGGRFMANKKIYDAVKNDYKSLRILELRISNYDEIKNLKFIFPLDKNCFNSKCLYFEENNDREPLND